jgi:septum formation protein
MKIILGSQSPQRQNLLHEAGFTFEIMTADIDEKSIRSDDFKKLPLLIAHAKSDALATVIEKPAILITSDTVVICNGELREKPESEEQAFTFLKTYSHYPAEIYSAVVAINTVTHKKAEGLDKALVYFRNIPDDVIQKLIKKERVLNAAGGFTIEDPLLIPYVGRIVGNKDTILGLPVTLTQKLINDVS